MSGEGGWSMSALTSCIFIMGHVHINEGHVHIHEEHAPVSLYQTSHLTFQNTRLHPAGCKPGFSIIKPNSILRTSICSILRNANLFISTLFFKRWYKFQVMLPFSLLYPGRSTVPWAYFQYEDHLSHMKILDVLQWMVSRPSFYI